MEEEKCGMNSLNPTVFIFLNPLCHSSLQNLFSFNLVFNHLNHRADESATCPQTGPEPADSITRCYSRVSGRVQVEGEGEGPSGGGVGGSKWRGRHTVV